ncbi:hypothetical protein C8A03DRAFT_36793 [Achaetomium macrosporum]|uniref:Uncharacterized protein n=1 Tax=Achaetomium macrosporum TaxID=79813 RepID=A0AAN7C5K4_9PEZI|nr:hypothetical protein C8A03DRAFT_36793 [Achaetomium macrosporum]
MTTRNLNQTWRDVVFNQYAADHAAGVPFPVRYLIYASQWNRDIFIEIPAKIDVFWISALQNATKSLCTKTTISKFALAFFRASHPAKMLRQRTLSLTRLCLGLVLLGTAANGWDFIVYGDSECETTPTAQFSGGDNHDCTRVPDPLRAFELHNMGNCWLWLYATEQDCRNRNGQQFYDATNEAACIRPTFQWDYFDVRLW